MNPKRWPIGKVMECLNYVGGKRIRPQFSSLSFKNFEPATGKVLNEVAESSRDDVNEAVASAKVAQRKWAALSGLDRARVLQRVAHTMKDNVDELAYWETKDNGKPLYESRIDILGCVDVFDFFGAAAATAHGRYHDLSSMDRLVYERHEPLGVCAAIGAWNYPLQTASWKIAPSLACGNSIVYKPSPWSPITVTLLSELLTEAGVPDGVCNVVQGGAITGTALCHHPDVAKVSFTGSVPTGLKIQQACATANLKPVTLELGGKSPLIIFEDADLDNAVTGTMMANWFTQGEVCSNAARVFVHRSIVKSFTQKLLERTKKMKIGNPYEDGITVGAMIHEEHMNKVLAYIESAKKEGGHIVYGGERYKPSDPTFADGYFVSPCIIDNCTDDMTVVREEVFGALLTILPFDDEEEAIRRANDTEFGLGAGLFTKDLRRAHSVSARLQAGNVYVNTFNDVAANVPFGGFKQSGYGRELGLQTMNQYCQVKSVWVNTSDAKIETEF